MKVIFLGAGPGDPDLLTVKAARLLHNCQCCIYAGSLVSPAVVALIAARAEKYDSASMTLEEIIAVCTKAREQGIVVIRLHTGDPSIFGAIGEQMTALDRLGIAYEVVPGVSSFQAAAAAMKTELTAPEVSQTIVLTRTAGRTPMPSGQDLEQMARTQATLCIFLSVHAMAEVAGTLAAQYGTDCPAAVVYHASWPDERVIRGTLEDIAGKVADAGIGKTAMIIVGRALARHATVSRLYSGQFAHGYRAARKP